MQQLSPWGILNETFAIICKRIRVLTVLAAIVYMPTVLVALVAELLGLRHTIQEYLQSGSISLDSLAYVMGLVIITFVSMTIGFAVVSVAVGQHLIDERISVRGCYKRVLWRLVSVIFASVTLLISLFIAVGGVVLILPTLVALAFILYASMTIPVITFEGLKYTDGIKRSFQLVHKELPRVILGLGLIGLLTVGLYVTLTLTLGMIDSIVGKMPMVALFVQLISGLVANCVLTMVVGISITLLYLDVRFRKEKLDLEILKRELTWHPHTAGLTQ